VEHSIWSSRRPLCLAKGDEEPRATVVQFPHGWDLPTVTGMSKASDQAWMAERLVVGLAGSDDHASGLRRAPAQPRWQPSAAEVSRLRAAVPDTCRGPLQVLQAFDEDLDGDGASEQIYAVAIGARPRSPCMADVLVMRSDGSVQRLVGEQSGPMARLVLGTTDVDRDGRREIVVYAPYVNEYDLSIFEWPCPDPVFGYRCGNI
jgi:hypothetical protein